MIVRISILAFALAVPTAFAQSATSQPDPARAKQIAETICTACHGPDGNPAAAAFPKLAGQHESYLLKQLHDFKAVGDKPAQRVNASMAPMVATLSDEDMKGLAKYFSSQKLKPDYAKNMKTVELGQKLWRAGNPSTGVPACAGCHGAAGQGIAPQYPRIAGQFADYIELQLKSFRTGDRANDPNGMMRGSAARLSDVEIKALADYIAGLR